MQIYLTGVTRHPNLALLKLAGFLKDNNVYFKLIESSDEDVSEFDIVYISKVFSFTKDPKFVVRALGTHDLTKFRLGGTGFYAAYIDNTSFSHIRKKDMEQFENDPFLNSLKNHRGGSK